MDVTNNNGDGQGTEKYKNISNFILPLPVLIAEISTFHQYLVISLEEAVRLAVEYFRDENEYPVDISCLNTLIRYHTKRLMKQKADLELHEDFDIDDKLPNIGLSAYFAGYHIRMFKDRTDHLLIPNSHVKEYFFSQQLSFNMGPAIPVSMINDRPNIMLLWNLDKNYTLLPLRLVCPKFGVINKNYTEVYYDTLLTEVRDYRAKPAKEEEEVNDDLNITKKDSEVELREEKEDHQDEKNHQDDEDTDI